MKIQNGGRASGLTTATSTADIAISLANSANLAPTSATSFQETDPHGAIDDVTPESKSTAGTVSLEGLTMTAVLTVPNASHHVVRMSQR